MRAWSRNWSASDARQRSFHETFGDARQYRDSVQHRPDGSSLIDIESTGAKIVVYREEETKTWREKIKCAVKS